METRQILTRRDTIIYALGVGAHELDFAYEEQLRALPTLAVVLTYPGFFWADPAFGADWKRLVHGEQSVTIHNPLPCEGEFVGSTVFEGVDDKGPGKGAVVQVARTITGVDGTLYAVDRRTAFLRGDGGCGSAGMALHKPEPVVANRDPDLVVTLATAPEQALIYRLSGDLNPLHVDPAVAKAGGFDRPILQGLCTYGVVGRALIAALCNNRTDRLRRLDARFSSPVYPGETIETRIWTGNGPARFEAYSVEREVRVLSHGSAEIA